MTHHDYDIAIVGAGPAGATLALSLAHSGLRIGIIDKARFPRDVICGDALSGQVLNVLKRMPDSIYQDFLRDVPKTPSWGIRFHSPGNHPLELPYIPQRTTEQDPPGYISPRLAFDRFLQERLSRYPSIHPIEGEAVKEVKIIPDGVELQTENRIIHARMVAGADGIGSLVRKSLSNRTLDKNYYCMAVRTYFEGVTGFHPENFIDLYFIKDLLPAYLWIFPEVDGRANVGLGLPYPLLIRDRLSLKPILKKLISSDPFISKRFINARQVTPIQARGLAIHRNLHDLSGDRYLLMGDAALGVDPFSGEGIGFAMASAESAAAVILECTRTGDYSASGLADYDHRIARRTEKEHNASAAMQRYARYSWLFNMVVKRANKSKAFQELLSAAFTNVDIRKRLGNPLFYLRMLLGG
ncbi:MAG: geranylgeranyl reductase family protein [Bacteroidales bacterium]|nr:geranylgeranyl reductase family protein [Bacteroidales bacterium]